MSAIDELAEAAVHVREAVGPAVVAIGRRHRRGAGVVVGEGRVLTNAHNLRGDEVGVTFADGRQAVGAVQGIDVDGDLATIAVDTADAPQVEWSDADSRIGSPVYALGPTIDGGVRITAGTVSATERSFRGPRGRLIHNGVEHTAPLARGSSGSPIVDSAGKLVGVNTHRLGDGFYLAVPATSDLRRQLDDLGEAPGQSRPRLGVAVAPAAMARKLRRSVGLPERDGLLVRGVEADSAADKAGVREGDLIVHAGDHDIEGIDDLHEVLDALAPDSSLALRVVRGADEIDVSVAFGDGNAKEEGHV